MFKLLVKDPNVQFVRLRQDFVALAIICPIIYPSKSHFVQLNVVCPVPAVKTFLTPGNKERNKILVLVLNTILLSNLNKGDRSIKLSFIFI